jgi:hypothetical protein
MSQLLQEIIRAVEEEIKPNIPSLSSERKRKDMRSTLLAMEKMIKHIRQELLKESKDIKITRKEKRINNIKQKNIPISIQNDE